MNRVIGVIDQAPAPLKVGLDVGAVGLAWGSFMTETLPVVATFLSIVWLCLQTYTWIINKKWRKKDKNRIKDNEL